MVETFNQKYLENRENQYINMTHVPRWFYKQVTYSNHEQAYIFVENDAIVPIENILYVIYHNLMKRSIRYDKKRNIPTN